MRARATEKGASAADQAFLLSSAAPEARPPQAGSPGWCKAILGLYHRSFRIRSLSLRVSRPSTPNVDWLPRIEQLRAGLARQGFEPAGDLPESTAPRLGRLLETVSEWNRHLDLTAARSADELVDIFLADAFLLGSVVASPVENAWADVGSGAGAPGVPLALLRPDLRLRFVEPMRKRVAFLRTCAGRLGMGRIDVKEARSEALPAGCVDWAVSRATFPPPVWLSEGARLARCGVWVLLAQGDEPQLPGWELRAVHSYRWPLTGSPRRAAEYTAQPGAAASLD